VAQRLWSALVLVVASEGARRVALSLGSAGPVAVLVGLCYAFSPRLLGTVPVITGESLPGAMLPWVVLPVLLHLGGRLGPGRALLLSGAAVVCMGGVNAVENAGALPLAVILVLWAAVTRRTTWRFVAAWGGVLLLATLWWVLPLMLVAGYAPPFYEYVESASNTTAIIGMSEAVRGDSHWVAYLVTGNRPWWPAAFALATETALVLVAAVVAAIGLVGLTRFAHPARVPLVFSLVLGLAALTVAHGGWEGSPVSGPVRELLDDQLQIFRNVHKIDPTVRLPLAIGFGHAVVLGWRWLGSRVSSATLAGAVALALPGLLVVSLAQPFLVNNARTPGWSEIPDSWVAARDYVAEHADGTRTLVLPGSGFAQNTWGWTLDEPLLVLGGADFVTRSQVPLIPGESIRFLDALDQLATTGRASSDLGEQLARAGVGHVILRRDLDRGLTRSPHPGGAATSLANGGLVSVATFGESENERGPAIEVLEVRERLPQVRTTPVDDVVTVRGGPESVLSVQQLGLVAPAQATVLQGEPGWNAVADVVTDDDQRRERSFGATDEVVSTLLGADEPWRTERTRHDYPTVAGQRQVVAQYDGLKSLAASSAQGYADNFGVIVPEAGPYAAFDGNLRSRWVSSRATDPTRQWLRAVFSSPRQVRTVSVMPVVDDDQIVPARVLEVRAGPQVRRVKVSPSGVPAVAEFDGSAVGSVQVRVVRAATAASQAPTGIREITIDDLEPHRTFAVPGALAEGGSFAFGTTPERRACFITVDVPDCSVARIRAAEEESGMDRTFTASGGRVALHGLVVARGTSEAARLLEPLVGGLQVGATSIYGFDPKVSSRFSYDGQVSTAWMSSPQDRNPTLLLRWGEQQRITGITVLSGESTEVPTRAIVRSGGREEEVSLTGDLALFSTRFRTRKLDISFVRPPGSERVVVPELRLVGSEISRTIDPDTATGAVCGLGPNVRLNGQIVPTRVTGSLRDVANGTPLRFESCALGAADGTADLENGVNRLSTEPTAEFDVLEVAGVPVDRAPTGEVAARTLAVGSWEDSERVVTIGAGEESLLFLPQNFNAGWKAELDGEELAALRVDGWQQAWVVPPGEGGQITMTYAPQRPYSLLLPTGLAVSGSVLVAGLVVLLGLLLRRSSVPSTWARLAASRRGPRPVTWTVSVGATLVLLGPVVLAGLLVGASARQGGHPRRRLRPTLVGVTVALAVLVVGSAVVDVVPLGGASRESIADVLAALGLGLLIGIVLGSVSTAEGEGTVA
jgi:arabinofuranan 3-O-arabinosyltransferase